jgi:uncharacterized protein YoxC
MANFGKKILSAFVDIQEEPKSEVVSTTTTVTEAKASYVPNQASNNKFKNYFEQLFKEANLPGPDYFEFSKMVEAMQVIPDERTRYISAFAGLSVQGLDKTKLTESANKYLEILDTDAANFDATINTALQEKVEVKKHDMEEKAKRIQQLSNEIAELNNSINLLGNEIKENEEKIRTNISGYEYELNVMKQKISNDLSKINQLI